MAQNTELYMKASLTRKVFLPFSLIGSNTQYNLEQRIKKIEGKCNKEGFVKPNSINILSYSAGELYSDKVVFHVLFECFICRPVEGMVINCNAKNITKAGIRAEIKGHFSPVIIFISRDHHLKHKTFSKIKENDDIIIRVIGKRYELNDEYISIIGELYKKKKKKLVIKKKT